MKKLIPILFLVFSMALFAQAPAEEPTEDPKAVQLTELESANVMLLAKDVQLGNQQMQLVQANYRAAVAGRDAAQAKLAALVLGLRQLHKAPEAEFSFDVGTMSFVPIPKEQAKKED